MFQTCLNYKHPLTEKLILNINIAFSTFDDLFISILYAMLLWIEAMTPIGCRSDQLHFARSLILQRLLCNRQVEWMCDVSSNRELRMLNTKQILIFPTQPQPRETIMPLIFVSLHKIPPADKVFSYIPHSWTNNSERHIMPRHSAIFLFVQLILPPVFHLVKVHHAVVVEVLTGPYFSFNTPRMDICQWMLMRIPAAKTEIKSAYKSQFVIDYNKLFVMSPVKRGISTMQERMMVWMPHNHNVMATRAVVAAHALQIFFGMLTVAAERLGYLRTLVLAL